MFSKPIVMTYHKWAYTICCIIIQSSEYVIFAYWNTDISYYHLKSWFKVMMEKALSSRVKTSPMKLSPLWMKCFHISWYMSDIRTDIRVDWNDIDRDIHFHFDNWRKNACVICYFHIHQIIFAFFHILKLRIFYFF